MLPNPQEHLANAFIRFLSIRLALKTEILFHSFHAKVFWYYFLFLFKFNSLVKKVLQSWLFSLCCDQSFDQSEFVTSCWGAQSKASSCHSRMWGQAQPARPGKGKQTEICPVPLRKLGKASLLSLYTLQGLSHMKNFPSLRLHFSGRRYLVVVKP